MLHPALILEFDKHLTRRAFAWATSVQFAHLSMLREVRRAIEQADATWQRFQS